MYKEGRNEGEGARNSDVHEDAMRRGNGRGMTVPTNLLGINNSLWSPSHEPELATLEKDKDEKDFRHTTAARICRK